MKSEPEILASAPSFEIAPPFAELLDSNETFSTVAVLFSPLRFITEPSDVETASLIVTFWSTKSLSSPSVESISNNDHK